MKFDEATEEGRNLRDAYGRAVGVATLHKKAERELTKNAMSMSIQAVQASKNKIADLRKSLNSHIRKFEKLGGV